MGKQNGRVQAGTGGAANAHGSCVITTGARIPRDLTDEELEVAALLFGEKATKEIAEEQEQASSRSA